MTRHYIFTIFFMAVDFVLNLFTKNDYALTAPVFIPCCYLIAFMLSCKEMELYDSLKFALIIGFFYSFFLPENLWTTIFALVIVALLIHFWSINISDSFLELLILAMIIIFFCQFVIYFVQLSKGSTTISFMFWSYRFLLPTIIGNIPIAMFVIYSYNSVVERVMEKAIEKERTEEMFWHKLRNHS